MSRSLTALALVLGLATFNAAHAAAPIQNCIGTPTGNGVTSASCGVTPTVGLNHSVIGGVAFYNSTGNPISTVVDDQGNTYTVLDTIGPHFGGGWYTATFVRYNITNSPKTVTVNTPGAGSTNNVQVWWSEYPGVGSTDVHTSSYISNVGLQAGQLQSGNVTTTNASDTIWGMAVTAAGSVEDTPVNIGSETGAVARISDTGHTGATNGNGAVTSDFSAPAGTVAAAFTSSVSDTQAAFVVAMKPLPVPTAISCTPAVLLDTAAMNTVVCTPTITMNDGSGFSGTLSVTPTLLFKIVGGNAELAAVPGAANDGTPTMTLSAVQNGTTVSKVFPVTINSASVSGTPYSFGWKNIDPGAGADGPGIVTMPKTGTINEIAVRVAVPATAPALFDIYHAAPGQVCNAGSKIHSGDFDASLPADNLQLVTGSNLLNTSLAVGDTVCVVTQPGFPTTGEVSLTVTVL